MSGTRDDMTDIEYIEFTVSSKKIEAHGRKLDIGMFPVCAKCGANLIQWPVECGPCDCGCSERMTLKKYVEDVRHEVFDASKWQIGEPDMLCLYDMDLESQIKNILLENILDGTNEKKGQEKD